MGDPGQDGSGLRGYTGRMGHLACSPCRAPAGGNLHHHRLGRVRMRMGPPVSPHSGVGEAEGPGAGLGSLLLSRDRIDRRRHPRSSTRGQQPRSCRVALQGMEGLPLPTVTGPCLMSLCTSPQVAKLDPGFKVLRGRCGPTYFCSESGWHL